MTPLSDTEMLCTSVGAEIFVTLPVLTLTIAALPLTLAATTVSDVSFAAKAHSVMPVLTDRSRLLPENTLI